MQISYRKELDNIPVYKPGKPIDDVKRELGLKDVVKLASNENPLGCSPKVKEAVLKALEEVNIYPDGNCTLLKEAIAKKFNVTPDMVLPTCGSDEMVDLVSKTFINKGDEVVMADITFPRYQMTAQMMGADIKLIPLKNMGYDLEGFKKAVTANTKIVWLCNPNNPTGTYFTEAQLVELLDAIPETALVVYDEAYNEFVTAKDYPNNSERFLKKYKNMIIMKTLSKAYGIAGLRTGYTIGDAEILSLINKIRNPFNVTLLSQAAALAALSDDEFLKATVDNNNNGKAYINGEFEKMGIEYVETQTNHIAFNIKSNADEAFNKLLRKGVIIRPIAGLNPNTWLRVSIGTQKENETFIAALKEIL